MFELGEKCWRICKQDVAEERLCINTLLSEQRVRARKKPAESVLLALKDTLRTAVANIKGFWSALFSIVSTAPLFTGCSIMPVPLF